MSACAKIRTASNSLLMLHKARNYSSSCSGGSLVVTKKHKKVTLIGLNRPEKRNSVNIQMLQELELALTNFENDDTSMAGVLYGEGGNFCSGYDLEELASEEHSKILLSNRLTERYVKKPLVAAISGYGVGFGFDLALWCDLRIMEDTSIIGFFGRRFGVPISNLSIQRLQCHIGLSRCMDLLLTGRGIGVADAHRFGLLQDVAACGTGQGFSLATCIAKFPQPSLLADRARAYKVAFGSQDNNLAPIEEEFSKNSQIAYNNVCQGAQLFLKGMGRHGKFTTKFEAESES